MGWNYSSIMKLQRLHGWSFEMDKEFHSTPSNGCNYLSMLGVKLFHISKMSLRYRFGCTLSIWIHQSFTKQHTYVFRFQTDSMKIKLNLATSSRSSYQKNIHELTYLNNHRHNFSAIHVSYICHNVVRGSENTAGLQQRLSDRYRINSH